MRAFVSAALALLAIGCASDAEPIAPSSATPQGAAASDTIVWPEWAARGPSPADFHRVYPTGAKADGLNGLVHLRCTVQAGLTFACAVEQETPAGHGFGPAALELVREFAVKADYPQVAPGVIVRVPIRFVLES